MQISFQSFPRDIAIPGTNGTFPYGSAEKHPVLVCQLRAPSSVFLNQGTKPPESDTNEDIQYHELSGKSSPGTTRILWTLYLVNVTTARLSDFPLQGLVIIVTTSNFNALDKFPS
ncbi:MAG: hypothetical protein N2663_03995 [Chlorobi bacterium]|nr:hypothetical protein [Chlorobiota bacterium]